MDEHVMLVPNTMATPVATTKTQASKARVFVTVALSLCVGGALFALGVVSSSAFHSADVVTTMSSIQSDVPVPEMNLESNQQSLKGADAIAANGRPFRFRLAGRNNLCVDTKDEMVSLAPCDPRATSQVFQYDKDTKSMRMAGTNECLGIDANKNSKLELCSASSSVNQAMRYDSVLDKFFFRTPTKMCLDNVAGETAGLPLSLKATLCDQNKRSQEFDILRATGGRLPPLETYPEMEDAFNIAMVGSGTQCLSVSGAAVSCTGDVKSRRFTYDAGRNQFITGKNPGTPMCVTAGLNETKSCANNNANQDFVYDYAKAMFRGPTDNYNLCFPKSKHNGLTMLRWCDNDKKLY